MAKIAKLSRLIEGAAEKFKDDRTTGGLITYNRLKKLNQCVMLTVTGNPDTNDADIFRYDPALLEALEVDPEGGGLASQPTIVRFLNNITKEELDALADWLLEFYVRQHDSNPRRIYLYADGTAVETYGKQEGTAYRGGKYKKEMYFPLLIFDQDGWLLTAKLRRGYESEAKTIQAELEKIVAKLRQRWRNVEIVLVVDSAFKSSGLLTWCEKNKVFYLAGYTNTFAIQSKLKEDRSQVEKVFKKRHGKPRFTGKHWKQDVQEEHERIRDIEDPKERMREEKAFAARCTRLIGEDTHKATTWPKEDPERRFVFRIDYTDTGFDTRCLLTNFTCYTADQLYEMYCQRGTSEQWIGELKHCLRFNSQRFRANQFRLFIHGLAYMLLWLLRSSCSAGFHRWSLQTIRKVFVQIPVAATFKSSRTTLWELTDRYQHQTELLRLVRKLEARAS